MLIKNLVISAAAGAIMLSSAAGVFAHHHSGGSFTIDSFNTSNKTVTVTKAQVNNDAHVTNNVFTGANTGLNETSVSGGKTVSVTKSGNPEEDGSSVANGGAVTGGNAAMVSTGDAGAMSSVSNVVNTTSISF